MTADVYVVGSAWQTVPDDTNLQLDELVFGVASRALKSAGVARHQVGLSVISSLDLYDGRSISNALTAPAAAGYFNEEFRVEGDALAALIMSLAALAAGQVDCAIVIGLHVPEIGRGDEAGLRHFREQVSSYTFDAHVDRPIGATSELTLGLHAARQVDLGHGVPGEWASSCARDITRGAQCRGVRPAADASAVLSSGAVVDPLTELMMPAACAGLGAVVLAAGVLGRRCPHPQARVAGWGMASAPTTSDPSWLTDPAQASQRAAASAYQRAGIKDPGAQVGLVEMTDLSPALTGDVLSALQLSGLASDRVNPSGGVRAIFPGNANGLLKAVDVARSLASGASSGYGVAHAMDDYCGLVSSTSSVLVLEEL